MTKRRKYFPEFKREAVLLTQQPGVSCRQIALDISVNPNQLNSRREAALQGGECPLLGINELQP